MNTVTQLAKIKHILFASQMPNYCQFCCFAENLEADSLALSLSSGNNPILFNWTFIRDMFTERNVDFVLLYPYQ